MSHNQLVSLKFCKDLEDFVKHYFHVDWPSFVNQNLDNVRKVFTSEIGLATLDRTIIRHRDIYVEDIEFNYSDLSRMRRQNAIHYIRENALKIRNPSVISFFIMCSFIGSICVFNVEDGRPELAKIPMSVLADIIQSEKIGEGVSWSWINEVATMLNRQQLLQIDGAVEVSSSPEDMDRDERDKIFDEMEDEAP